MCEADGARAGLAAAYLGDHDRLAGLECPLGQRQQAGAVLEALDVAAADLDARIGQHLVHDLDQGRVAFVAGVDEIAQAEVASARQRGDRRAEGARLGDEADGALEHLAAAVLAEGRDHAVERVDQPEAVRPAQAHVTFACDGEQFILQYVTLLAHLAETRAVDDRGRHALLPERAHLLDHEACRHRDDRHVDRIGDVADRRVAAQLAARVADLLVLRIHRVDLPGITLFDEELERAAVQFLQVVRCAEDGDRARSDQGTDGRVHGRHSNRRGSHL